MKLYFTSIMQKCDKDRWYILQQGDNGQKVLSMGDQRNRQTVTTQESIVLQYMLTLVLKMFVNLTSSLLHQRSQKHRGLGVPMRKSQNLTNMDLFKTNTNQLTLINVCLFKLSSSILSHFRVQNVFVFTNFWSTVAWIIDLWSLSRLTPLAFHDLARK